jgi:hypothetical protein
MCRLQRSARLLGWSPRLRTGDRLLGAGRRFALDEQRAIGEMMQRDGDEPGCTRFATFANSYEERFSRWFANFAADLEELPSAASNRLANLHRVTVRLARELDVDRTLIEFDKSGDLLNPRGLFQRAWQHPIGMPIRSTASRRPRAEGEARLPTTRTLRRGFSATEVARGSSQWADW